MERELVVEHTRAGLAAAKAVGRTGGRKRRMTDSKIASARKLLTSGVPPKGGRQEPGRVDPDTVSLGSPLRRSLDLDDALSPRR